MGWDLEATVASSTHDEIVDADHVVSQLTKHRPVVLIGAPRWPILFHAPDPANLVIVTMATLGAGICRRLQFLFFVKEFPLM
ncbi:MAG: hypothetical protein MK358_09765 [Vicinamibacterales bacterium]|nr:hypothetical protein [Vicinamibacterales bacterium]